MRGGIDQHLIAREGRWIIIALVLVTLCSYLYFSILVTFFSLIILVSACFVLRNPRLDIPAMPLAVFSPVNGKLLSVEKSEDPWLSRNATRIQVYINFWDVHTVRSPVEGKIMNEWSSDSNEPGYNRRYTYWFQTDEGDNVVISFLLGKFSPFTRMLIRSGERIGQGEYCGFLYFSGLVEIFMPVNSRIIANPGARVHAGLDTLGNFVHEEGVSGLG